jgi:hypothetical protein
VATSVFKVKHWTVVGGDYTLAPDVEATWFIDPPYRGGPGMGYRFGSDALDYKDLAGWILGRHGQVIACESLNGDYLPFVPLRINMGVAGKQSTEVIWLNDAEEMARRRSGRSSRRVRVPAGAQNTGVSV